MRSDWGCNAIQLDEARRGEVRSNNGGHGFLRGEDDRGRSRRCRKEDVVCLRKRRPWPSRLHCFDSEQQRAWSRIICEAPKPMPQLILSSSTLANIPVSVRFSTRREEGGGGEGEGEGGLGVGAGAVPLRQAVEYHSLHHHRSSGGRDGVGSRHVPEQGEAKGMLASVCSIVVYCRQHLKHSSSLASCGILSCFASCAVLYFSAHDGFVLFMGGMEVDVPGFLKRWKLGEDALVGSVGERTAAVFLARKGVPVLINGLGQIALNFAVFAGLGAGTGTTKDTVSTIYFGLACTFSSTILVLGALKSRGDMDTSE
eukprot:754354-Hanusia_phi.AAC.1